MIKIKYKSSPKSSKDSLVDFLQFPAIAIVILQHKRVIAPYIFCKYLYPIYKSLYSGRINLHIVQHTSDLSTSSSFLKSSSFPKECLGVVKFWTQKERFRGAKIFAHSQNLVSYPSIPSVLKSFSIIKTDDLCLHLEDDSLVMDSSISKWDEILSEYEMGTYRLGSFGDSFYSESARYISRKSFRKRFLAKYNKLEKWSSSSIKTFYDRLEIRMSNIISQKILELEGFSFKDSPPDIKSQSDYINYKKKYLFNIKEFLNRSEISYLDSDFDIFEGDYIY